MLQDGKDALPEELQQVISDEIDRDEVMRELTSTAKPFNNKARGRAAHPVRPAHPG